MNDLYEFTVSCESLERYLSILECVYMYTMHTWHTRNFFKRRLCLVISQQFAVEAFALISLVNRYGSVHWL